MPLAIYSFKISFCIVPVSLFEETPWFSAATMYNAYKIGAVALIVIEVDTASNFILSNNIFISSIVEIGTPTFPTSPFANS